MITLWPTEIASSREVTQTLALLDRLERALAPGPWIVGEFSLADISVAPFMFRLSALGQDQFCLDAKRPLVNAWYVAISKRPAFNIAVSWPDECGGGYKEVGLKTTTPIEA